MQKGNFISYYQSPIGNLKIIATTTHLTNVSFGVNETIIEAANENEITALTTKELELYFNGMLQQFKIPLQPKGTDFQQGVWQQLQKIQFGTTTNYLQQSKNLGNVKAIRAMASANGKNPIAIIIPCHRVIGSNGSLVGYAGELWRKQWLLQHELKIKGTVQFLF